LIGITTYISISSMTLDMAHRVQHGTQIFSGVI
jgi:hypothetical protein